MPLKEVAVILGAPHYWSPVGTDSVVPCFWGYRHLELRFSERSPYRLISFKLHNAFDLKGRSVALCTNLRLSLDGFSGAMRPSEFLCGNPWGSRRIFVDVQLVAGELQLRISARPVEFLYVMSDDEIGDLEALIAAFHRRDWPPVIAQFEQVSRLHGIYCYSPAEWRSRGWKAPRIEIDGSSYLAFVPELKGADSVCPT